MSAARVMVLFLKVKHVFSHKVGGYLADVLNQLRFAEVGKQLEFEQIELKYTFGTSPCFPVN